MTTADPRLLVLVGPMGAGKTSIGRRAAKLLALAFIDTDREIVKAHGPIPEIFAEHGEAQFRAWEEEAVAAAIDRGGVVSLGGGAVTSPAVRELLRPCPVAYLLVSADAVARRIGGQGRPLLSEEEDPVARWKEIFSQRQGWYEEIASATFDTSRTPMQRVAEDVATWAKDHTRTTEADR